MASIISGSPAIVMEHIVLAMCPRLLDDMAGQLESDAVSLEESFRLYEQGMRLLKTLNDRIDRVEKKMQQIDDEGQIGDFE